MRPSTHVLRRLGLTAALLLGALGCAHTPKGGAAIEPEISTYEAEFQEQTISGVKLNFPWGVKNPTGKAITVNSVRYKLAIEGEPDFLGVLEPKVSVPAAGSVNQTFAVDAPLATTDVALTARQGKTSLRFGLTAVFTVAAESGPQDYEAEWFGDIFPPQRPTVTVEPQAARYGSSTSKVELTFTLVVNNPNPFVIPTEGLDYVIEIADIKALEGTVAQNQKLAANAEREFDLSKIVGDGSDKNLAQALANRSTFPYRFEGTLRAGTFTLKKVVEGEIAFAH